MALTTELTETSLTMRQVVPARIERVYAAWTEPERLAEWWCRPPGWAQPELHCEVRPGGEFRAVMRTEDDAEPYEVRGRYLELVPNEKVVFTWRWLREPGAGREESGGAQQDKQPQGQQQQQLDELRDRLDHLEQRLDSLEQR